MKPSKPETFAAQFHTFCNRQWSWENCVFRPGLLLHCISFYDLTPKGCFFDDAEGLFSPELLLLQNSSKRKADIRSWTGVRGLTALRRSSLRPTDRCGGSFGPNVQHEASRKKELGHTRKKTTSFYFVYKLWTNKVVFCQTKPSVGFFYAWITKISNPSQIYVFLQMQSVIYM